MSVSLPSTAQVPGVAVGRADFLRLDVKSGSNNLTIQLHGRIIGADDRSIPFSQQIITDNTTDYVTVFVSLADGLLDRLYVTATDDFVNPGTIHTRVSIQCDNNPALNPALTLISGYPSAEHPLSWPWMERQSPFDTAGNMRVFTSANPAAGADPTLTLPDNLHYRIISVITTLTTSATAANRSAVLTAAWGGSTRAFASPSQQPQPAGITREYNFFPGATADIAANPIASVHAIPDIILPASSIVAITSINLEADDDWDILRVYAETWPLTETIFE